MSRLIIIGEEPRKVSEMNTWRFRWYRLLPLGLERWILRSRYRSCWWVILLWVLRPPCQMGRNPSSWVRSHPLLLIIWVYSSCLPTSTTPSSSFNSMIITIYIPYHLIRHPNIPSKHTHPNITTKQTTLPSIQTQVYHQISLTLIPASCQTLHLLSNKSNPIYKIPHSALNCCLPSNSQSNTAKDKDDWPNQQEGLHSWNQSSQSFQNGNGSPLSLWKKIKNA